MAAYLRFYLENLLFGLRSNEFERRFWRCMIRFPNGSADFKHKTIFSSNFLDINKCGGLQGQCADLKQSFVVKKKERGSKLKTGL